MKVLSQALRKLSTDITLKKAEKVAKLSELLGVKPSAIEGAMGKKAGQTMWPEEIAEAWPQIKPQLQSSQDLDDFMKAFYPEESVLPRANIMSLYNKGLDPMGTPAEMSKIGVGEGYRQDYGSRAQALADVLEGIESTGYLQHSGAGLGKQLFTGYRGGLPPGVGTLGPERTEHLGAFKEQAAFDPTAMKFWKGLFGQPEATTSPILEEGGVAVAPQVKERALKKTVATLKQAAHTAKSKERLGKIAQERPRDVLEASLDAIDVWEMNVARSKGTYGYSPIEEAGKNVLENEEPVLEAIHKAVYGKSLVGPRSGKTMEQALEGASKSKIRDSFYRDYTYWRLGPKKYISEAGDAAERTRRERAATYYEFLTKTSEASGWTPTRIGETRAPGIVRRPPKAPFAADPMKAIEGQSIEDLARFDEIVRVGQQSEIAKAMQVPKQGLVAQMEVPPEVASLRIALEDDIPKEAFAREPLLQKIQEQVNKGRAPLRLLEGLEAKLGPENEIVKTLNKALEGSEMSKILEAEVGNYRLGKSGRLENLFPQTAWEEIRESTYRSRLHLKGAMEELERKKTLTPEEKKIVDAWKAGKKLFPGPEKRPTDLAALLSESKFKPGGAAEIEDVSSEVLGENLRATEFRVPQGTGRALEATRRAYENALRNVAPHDLEVVARKIGVDAKTLGEAISIEPERLRRWKFKTLKKEAAGRPEAEVERKTLPKSALFPEKQREFAKLFERKDIGSFKMVEKKDGVDYKKFKEGKLADLVQVKPYEVPKVTGEGKQMKAELEKGGFAVYRRGEMLRHEGKPLRYDSLEKAKAAAVKVVKEIDKRSASEKSIARAARKGKFDTDLESSLKSKSPDSRLKGLDLNKIFKQYS